MKNQQNRSSLLGVMVFFLVAAVMMSGSVAIAAGNGNEKENCFLISLHGWKPPVNVSPAADETPVNIYPQYARVAQGSCIIWVNWVRRPGIRISLQKGAASRNAIQAARGFNYDDATSSYRTDFFDQGGVVSMRLMEPGTYKYSVNIQGRIAPVATGDITVTKR